MCLLECSSFPQTQSYIGLSPSEELHIKTHQNEAEHFDLILSVQPQPYLSSCLPDRKAYSFQEVLRPH